MHLLLFLSSKQLIGSYRKIVTFLYYSNCKKSLVHEKRYFAFDWKESQKVNFSKKKKKNRCMARPGLGRVRYADQVSPVRTSQMCCHNVTCVCVTINFRRQLRHHDKLSIMFIFHLWEHIYFRLEEKIKHKYK